MILTDIAFPMNFTDLYKSDAYLGLPQNLRWSALWQKLMAST